MIKFSRVDKPNFGVQGQEEGLGSGALWGRGCLRVGGLGSGGVLHDDDNAWQWRPHVDLHDSKKLGPKTKLQAKSIWEKQAALQVTTPGMKWEILKSEGGFVLIQKFPLNSKSVYRYLPLNPNMDNPTFLSIPWFEVFSLDIFFFELNGRNRMSQILLKKKNSMKSHPEEWLGIVWCFLRFRCGFSILVRGGPAEFWPQRGGGLSPTFAQHRGFLLICLKTEWFWKNLKGKWGRADSPEPKICSK